MRDVRRARGAETARAYLPRVVVPCLVLLLFVSYHGRLPFVGDAARAWFAVQCHRMPERTIVFAGTSLPVCARCAGIYLGLAGGALLPLALERSTTRAACAAAGLLLLAFVELEHAFGLDFSNPGRFVIGVVFASPFGVHIGRLATGRPVRP